MIHNESVNVWTHLLGALLFMFLFWHSLLMLGCAPQTPQLSQAFNQTKIQEWKDFIGTQFELSKSKISELESQALNYSYELEHRIADWYTELQIEASNFSSSFKNDTYLKYQIFQGKLNQFGQTVSNSFGLESWEPIERWPMVVFVLSATFCLSCSVICHLFCAHSPDVCSLVMRLDYAGISILIAGSYFPVIFYIFYCNSIAILVYLTCITLACVFVFCIMILPSIQKPEYRTLRGMSFVSLGLLGIVPLSHMLTLSDIWHFTDALVWFIFMCLCYLAGVGVYILRIPERYFPGKFDLWGSSHNIWHCCVLAAVLCHYVGSRWSFYLRHEATCEVL